MLNGPGAARPLESDGYGLRFLNEEWNESISNGQPFTLLWNESIDGSRAQLGVFRVTYPDDGLLEYQLVTNLTDIMGPNKCEWTPDHLDDNLYALWLTAVSDGNQSWTMSPPWRLRNYEHRGLHWAAPIGIPIVAILAIYFISLTVCLLCRRRKRLKRERGADRNTTANRALEIEDPAGRHPSVSSVETAQTYDEPAFKKPETVVLLSHEDRDLRTAEREPIREPRRSLWLENTHFNNFHFGVGRGKDRVRVVNENGEHRPTKPEDMYVAPGTAI
ncbi:hypothetical protein BGZ63DRAFT_419502 [Mariannaea sp. PMI_226]|nr:hypothetical protein BGZ63DRAFT_419502 [Mariannaea sp. PMI_226]